MWHSKATASSWRVILRILGESSASQGLSSHFFPQWFWLVPPSLFPFRKLVAPAVRGSSKLRHSSPAEDQQVIFHSLDSGAPYLSFLPQELKVTDTMRKKSWRLRNQVGFVPDVTSDLILGKKRQGDSLRVVSALTPCRWWSFGRY